MGRLSTRKKLAFSALTTLLALAAIELAARALYFVRSLRGGAAPGDTAVVRRFHPLRYELAPGQSLPANGPVAHINREGLRGAELEPTGQRARVLCVGDSCTFGYAPDVTDDKTYPALLGRQLEREEPGRFEVCNGGMPSFCSLDCLDFWIYRGVELGPRYVVVMVGWNDSHHCQPLDNLKSERRPSPLESLAAYRLAGELGSRWQASVAPDPARLARQLKRLPPPTDHLSDAVFARFERILEEFARSIRASGAEPIFVTLPNFAREGWDGVDSLTPRELVLMMPHLSGGNLSPRGWLRFITETNRAIVEAARRRDVVLVDGSSIRDMNLFIDICHLNAAGNEALARLIAPSIVGRRR